MLIKKWKRGKKMKIRSIKLINELLEANAKGYGSTAMSQKPLYIIGYEETTKTGLTAYGEAQATDELFKEINKLFTNLEKNIMEIYVE